MEPGEGREATHEDQHARNQGQGISRNQGGGPTHEEPRPRNCGEPRGATQENQHARNQGQETEGKQGGKPG